MANPEYLQVLKKGVVEWNRWREEHHNDIRYIRLDLTGADLTRGSLSGVNLSMTDLSEANLTRTRLSESQGGFPL